MRWVEPSRADLPWKSSRACTISIFGIHDEVPVMLNSLPAPLHLRSVSPVAAGVVAPRPRSRGGFGPFRARRLALSKPVLWFESERKTEGRTRGPTVARW